MILPVGLSHRDSAGQNPDHHVLRVDDPAIIDEPADYVILRECRTANDGDVVLALIDGVTPTIKRLHREGDSICLESTRFGDPEVATYPADRVSITGVIVGVIRTY